MSIFNSPAGTEVVRKYLEGTSCGGHLWFICFHLPNNERLGKDYKVLDREIRESYEGAVVWHRDNNVYDAEYSGMKQAGRAALAFYQAVKVMTVRGYQQCMSVGIPYMFGFSEVEESVLGLRLRLDTDWIGARRVPMGWLDECAKRFEAWDIPMIVAERKRYKVNTEQYDDLTRAIQIAVKASLRDDMIELCAVEMDGTDACIGRHAEIAMRRENSWLFV